MLPWLLPGLPCAQHRGEALPGQSLRPGALAAEDAGAAFEGCTVQHCSGVGPPPPPETANQPPVVTRTNVRRGRWGCNRTAPPLQTPSPAPRWSHATHPSPPALTGVAAGSQPGSREVTPVAAPRPSIRRAPPLAAAALAGSLQRLGMGGCPAAGVTHRAPSLRPL